MIVELDNGNRYVANMRHNIDPSVGAPGDGKEKFKDITKNDKDKFISDCS
jgi:hypothetical protein